MAVILERLRLHDYRNIAAAEIELSPEFNLLAGQNAQGKTSVLEAITLLSLGRVVRGTRDTEAIREGAEAASVFGEIQPTGTALGMELFRGRKKRALLNGLGLTRASDLLGRLPSVSFWAGDLELVTGEPAGRRLMMDSELSQLYPSYFRHLAIYKRALEQRNALLKLASDRFVGDEQFEVWEAQLGESGHELRSFRVEWCEMLAPLAAAAHGEMAPGEALSLVYMRKDEEPDLTLALAQSRGRDIARGSTSVGPHRDDLEIMVGGRLARQFGSQGQQRTSVISLKIAVLDLAKQIIGFPPLLLLDDIFSDLDEHRRARLVHTALTHGGQVVVTCTEATQAGGELVGRSKIFRVNQGQVQAQ